MSGKWPMIGVLGLGLVASLCAAVLMAAMRSDGGVVQEAAPTEIEVLVANADLPAMTRVENDLIEVKLVNVGDRPEGSFADPVQVLGRVLKTALVAGQPIVATGLLNEEIGAKVASSLPDGLRAVSIELPSSSAMRGLLYPGCSVDVIVAYRQVARRSGDTRPASRTLLQNVSVLAVEDKTVFTPDEEADEEEDAPRRSRQPNRKLMVTLMVEPQQARELQAARDRGELALSLRNPLDGSMTMDPMAEQGEVVAEKAPEEHTGPWRIVVIRGDETEIRTFDGDGENEIKEEQFADAPTEPPLEIDE